VRNPFRIQITPQHNSLKTRITPKLATAIRYQIFKHSATLRHKVIRTLPKHNGVSRVWQAWLVPWGPLRGRKNGKN